MATFTITPTRGGKAASDLSPVAILKDLTAGFTVHDAMKNEGDGIYRLDFAVSPGHVIVFKCELDDATLDASVFSVDYIEPVEDMRVSDAVNAATAQNEKIMQQLTGEIQQLKAQIDAYNFRIDAYNFGNDDAFSPPTKIEAQLKVDEVDNDEL